MKISKMIKIFSLILVSSLLFSLPVSAAEHLDYHEMLGLTLEEFQGEQDENGVSIREFPQMYALGTIDENINLDNGIYYVYMNGSTSSSGSVNFGSAVEVSGEPRHLTMTLANSSNSVLFSNAGLMVFRLKAYCSNVDMFIYHNDGTSEKFSYSPDPALNYVIDVDYINTSADVYKIGFIFTGGIEQSYGIKIISGGVLQYSYDTDSIDFTMNIFESISHFFSNFGDTLKNAFASFFGVFDNNDELSELVDNFVDLSESFSEDNFLTLEGFEFDDGIWNNQAIIFTLSWIGSILQFLFDSTLFSVLFTFTAMLLIISIVLGFARNWRSK